MSKELKNTAVARQVEMIIRQLPTLATLPEVAAGFLPNLVKAGPNVPALAEIIEADPALTAELLSLAHKHGLAFSNNSPSIKEAVEKLPASVVRDAVLSVKVFEAFDADYDPDAKRILPRKRFALHCLAVACAARRIAELTLPDNQRELAFSAGLLHDIGKLALYQAMPKSFEKMVSQARAERQSLAVIERRNLGLDHMVIGKRLGEKWHLPNEIILAIWMHHSELELLRDDMPGSEIAQVVRLADVLSRSCGIGDSGSYDAADVNPLAESVGLTVEQVDEIAGSLEYEVNQKSDLLGLKTQGGAAAYCEMMHEAAADLSRNNTKLNDKNRELEADSVQMSLIRDLLVEASPATPAIELAADFARRFKKIYQTGPVCVYMKCADDEECIEASVIGDDGSEESMIVPADGDLMPEEIRTQFAVIPAARALNLIELLNLQIDTSHSLIVPLVANGRAVAAMIFEQRMPVETAKLHAGLEVLTSVAASVLAGAVSLRQQSRLAEQFASVLNNLKESREELTQARSLAGIAEMAAGAAHELNNPLAVISGRAQLLLEVEKDGNKKQMLTQIRQRTEEMADIVNELMAFAKPAKPEPRILAVTELLDKAVAKTVEKHSLEAIETDYDRIQPEWQVNVDPEQVTAAISNILSNALESYKGGNGPIALSGGTEPDDAFITIEIADKGLGMAEQTLTRAVQPFYSDKPAGRQRGMGLAQAQRLLRLNGGSLTLASRPAEGTTVTLKLPKA